MFSRPRFITAFALIARMAQIAFGLGTTETVADVSDRRLRRAHRSRWMARKVQIRRRREERTVSVQFNSRGKLGGDAASFFWNKTDKRLGIVTKPPNEQLEITGNLRLAYQHCERGGDQVRGSPFIHNFGTNNTFIGVDAGNFSMTGRHITAIGEMRFTKHHGEGNTADRGKRPLCQHRGHLQHGHRRTNAPSPHRRQ